MILRTFKPLAKNLTSANENNIIKKVGNNSEDGRVKKRSSRKIRKMAKLKNLVRPEICNFSKFIEYLKIFGLGFFTFEVRLVFTKLKQAFIETLVFYYFHPECYIQIKTDIFSYAINRVLN